MAESAGVQEYLETIYRLTTEAPNDVVSTSALAAGMGIAAASASEMLKRLAALGYVEYRPYAGARLTADGLREAATVLRYHRLWERFLVDVLGMGWDQVHEEACRLEHATTPEIALRLSEFLAEPSTCPHGNPMPPEVGDGARKSSTRSEPAGPAESRFAEAWRGRLIDADTGCRGRVISVAEEPGLLRYCSNHGLVPGARFRITAVHPVEQIVDVLVDATGPLVVGPRIGSQVMIACEGQPRDAAGPAVERIS